MRILVAEDDATSRAMLESVLTRWGYQVVEAVDGHEAWSVLQGPDAPQLCILDWIMPGIDGVELCRRLRAEARQDPLYLILLTARDGSANLVQGLEAGADDYITKPYDLDELRARVLVGRRILNLYQELREREKLVGVLEMARAVCHELNQPLQSVLGFSELLLMDMEEGSPHYETVAKIASAVEQLGNLTKKIMRITKYRIKPYMGEKQIVDIDSASA